MENFLKMDHITADLAFQAYLATGRDYIGGGIDNESFDIPACLDELIAGGGGTEGAPTDQGGGAPGAYFTPAPTPSSAGTPDKRPNGHSLPESPPDSSSEHPYSPQEGCEPPLAPSDNMYTNIAQPLYKPIINSILEGNLILESHIVVADQNEGQIIDENGLLNNNLLIREGNGILLTENVQDNSRQLLLPTTNESQNFDRNMYKNNEDLHLSFSNIDNMPRQHVERNICDQNLDNIQGVYTNLQNASKKRKLSQDSPLVKSEPEHCQSQLSPPEQLATPIDEEYQSSEACLSESQYQCIRFSNFQPSNWHLLCDQNLSELPTPHYRVDADKGFNFSNADDAFVCQKKNHFQITCHVQLLGDAQFVKTSDGIQKICSFHLHFYGVKYDCPTQTIRVEQSQSDRSKKPFHPVPVELVNSQMTKVTVGRLHFSETTSNNMRKKGKPNPEQRYFQLVVGLHAHTANGNFPVVSHASQKIIVRASNPGQFESDVELCWQKGQTQDSVFHNGRVGINTDRPDESLVVHGNIKITGHIIQPSDIRAKKNIVECNTADQLRNVQRIRVVKYDYNPGFASQLCRNECSDTGVIAQEVAEIIPEAVRPAGDLILENGTSIDNFLVVNKERIFMENIGAVKELCKVTDNLETRIDQLERLNRRVNKLKRGDSLKSTSTVTSSKHSFSHKCSKHHTCHKEEELCSNKFIQIVIVVLVLIMAFCLAAITTLYLIETARHNQYIQATLDGTQRALATKRPVKSSKPYNTWSPTIQPKRTTTMYRNLEDEVTKITVDSNFIKRPSFIIGRPSDCLTVEQDLESTHLCKIYCCATPPHRPPDLVPTIYSEKHPRESLGTKNKTRPLIAIEKNKNTISKPFHSNDIDKQIRQKRDTYDLTDEGNFFDLTGEDQMFHIVVQGRNFNTTLSQKYLRPISSSNNISYSVPISKYMPDDFINLVFRSTQTSIREIERCYNEEKQNMCPVIEPPSYFEDKSRVRQKVNEDNPSQLLSPQTIIFEVDMTDFQAKLMTYRVSLRQSQNICNLSPKTLGVEYIEYNFYFYRHCDE